MKKILLILFIAICGIVNAQYTKLLEFAPAANGNLPRCSLVSDGTFLYGMTSQGGINNMGTIFKIMPNGTGYVKLLDFAGAANGANPQGSLIFDGTFLYGMTYFGGINDLGTMFKILPNGTGYVKLLDFAGAANGGYPYGSLVSDGTFLYGMTSQGGTNSMGTMFKIMPNGTGYVKLLDFAGAANGAIPQGSLVSDGTFLYGMTYFGGINDLGTMFKILPNGTGYVKLLDFAGAANGGYPYGSLVSDGTFLYGMTSQGGTNSMGTMFKIMPNGTGYVKLLDFAGAANGGYPNGSLVSDGTFLYGMTFFGGINSVGTMFKIMPNGTGYVKLLDFAGAANGGYPNGSLVSDGTFLYGMTSQGGINNMGTMFKILPNGTGYVKLLDFAGAANGSYPYGSLVSDGTFLYGMTVSGGINSVGTMFKIMPNGTGYVKLLDFASAANGSYPNGSLVSDGTFLYGMTPQGGINNLGTMFKILPNGTGYVKLLDFAGGANGGNPYGSLIFDGTFLYGMTGYGGTNNLGTMFKIMPNGTGYVKLLDFAGAANGSYPYGSLVSDGTFLYGMTSQGGTNGMGTMFKIMPNGTGYVKLLDFAGAANGANPQGSLIFDGTFLYGMTSQGGTNYLGTMFKILPNGTGYVKLMDFAGAANGGYPYGSLVSDGTFLYGMTYYGGTNSMGTMFKIMPNGTGYVKLMDFAGAANGAYPRGSLVSDGTFLYGMTPQGGTNSLGTMFKILPNGTGYVKLMDFAGVANGSNSYGSLVSDCTFLYGMTGYGGTGNIGTVFKYQYAPTTLIVTVTSASICAGQTTTLTASGASTYTWSANAGGATTASVAVTPTVNTTYTITATTGTCTAIQTVAINVNATPTITVNSGAICSGNSFTMAPSGANTYTYSGGSAVVSPSTNTSYSVTGTNTAGCISSQAISSVTVNATPTIAINSGAICAGQSFTMSPSGANTYTYSGGSAVVSPTTNTSYSVTGTSVQGCVSASPAVSSVTVNATPTITVNSGAICAGQSFTMSPSGANTYTYSGGSAVVSPTTNTSYSVTGTSVQGCVSASPAVSSVTVNATPTITVNSGAICAGQSFTMSPSGANTYTYSGGSAVVSPTTNTSYSVTGTSVQGCVSASPAISSVTVNATPTITVNSGAICSGQSFTMSPSGANTYTYSGGSAVVSPTVTSSYSVTGTNAAGCVSAAPAISNVTVNATPSVSATTNNTLICVGESATLTASGANTYTWNPGGTGTSIAVSPSVTTTYTVSGTDANSCMNSSVLTQSVSACAGITQYSNINTQISIYPNPFNNKVTIILNETKQTIQVFSVLGSVIYSSEIKETETEIDLTQQPSGIYFIRVGSVIKKIIKE